METFNYKILKQTDKAIFAEVPYFETTLEDKKKHKQLFFKCWIPKQIIDNGNVKHFVVLKRNEIRLSNNYQKLCSMPKSWETMGLYAPIKICEKIDVIDYDKVKELIGFYEKKYGSSLRNLINDQEGNNGVVSDNDYQILKDLLFPHITKIHTPKKQITIYK